MRLQEGFAAASRWHCTLPPSSPSRLKARTETSLQLRTLDFVPPDQKCISHLLLSSILSCAWLKEGPAPNLKPNILQQGIAQTPKPTTKSNPQDRFSQNLKAPSPQPKNDKRTDIHMYIYIYICMLSSHVQINPKEPLAWRLSGLSKSFPNLATPVTYLPALCLSSFSFSFFSSFLLPPDTVIVIMVIIVFLGVVTTVPSGDIMTIAVVIPATVTVRFPQACKTHVLAL